MCLALFCDYYNPHGECEWHYEPCGAPCLKTCRNPSGRCLMDLPGLEGETLLETVLSQGPEHRRLHPYDMGVERGRAGWEAFTCGFYRVFIPPCAHSRLLPEVPSRQAILQRGGDELCGPVRLLR